MHSSLFLPLEPFQYCQTCLELPNFMNQRSKHDGVMVIELGSLETVFSFHPTPQKLLSLQQNLFIAQFPKIAALQQGFAKIDVHKFSLAQPSSVKVASINIYYLTYICFS